MCSWMMLHCAEAKVETYQLFCARWSCIFFFLQFLFFPAALHSSATHVPTWWSHLICLHAHKVIAGNPVMQEIGQHGLNVYWRNKMLLPDSPNVFQFMLYSYLINYFSSHHILRLCHAHEHIWKKPWLHIYIVFPRINRVEEKSGISKPLPRLQFFFFCKHNIEEIT